MTKVLIKSRKIGYRSWTVCLALLTVLALSSCTKKSDDATANKSGSDSTAQSSTSTPSTTASKDTTTTGTTGSSTSTTASKDTTTTGTTGSSKKSKTLSPEVEKLGVKPTGSDCPSNAPIKGNINKQQELIYHEAKAKGYKQVKAEICFKDVATAQKAGFRAPKGAAAKKKS
jgi:hypothetical protein